MVMRSNLHSAMTVPWLWRQQFVMQQTRLGAAGEVPIRVTSRAIREWHALLATDGSSPGAVRSGGRGLHGFRP